MTTVTIEQLCTRALDAQRFVDAVIDGENDYVNAYEGHTTKFDFAAGITMRSVCNEPMGWYDPSWWLGNEPKFAELVAVLARFGVVLTA